MKKPAVFFFALLLIGCLGYGLVRLFMVRFAQGDVYPLYSTLRADGLGSKALYDSLAELTRVERNYTQLSRVHPEGNNTAIFFLGVPDGPDDDEDTDEALESLSRDGNRVVLAFVPRIEKPFEPWPTSTPANTPGKDDKKSAQEKEKKKADAEAREIDLEKTWGVKTAYHDKMPGNATTDVPGLEPVLAWHTVLYFDRLAPEWRVLYKSGGKPVIIERPFGAGSVVLVADAYFSSNEALSNARLDRRSGDPDSDRATGLIAALVGNKATVIFDETHLGVTENPGVATLIRKYQMQGVVFALMVVAAFFVWHNAVAFVPRRQEEIDREEAVQGVDASAAFVSLLRRNIPVDKIVATCLAEWKRSFGHRAKPQLVARVELLAAPGAKEPVETFRMITQTLNEKK